MRRSKRLEAKKAGIFSETEGSSQEETADIESLDLEALVSKAYDYIKQKIATNEQEQVDDQDVSSERIASSSSQEEEEEPGKAEEFITLPTEFKRKLKEPSQLSSELQVGMNTEDLYLKFDKTSFKPAITSRNFDDVAGNNKELMKRSVITSDFEKRHSVPPMHVSQYANRKQKKKTKEESAGPMWFNLPATQITPEIEQDMKIIKMRNILDRKRHYKKNDSSALPKYFQIGTVVEGSAEFYTSRIPKRQRKNNMIDELLSDAEFRRYNKKKYLEIQAAKQSGKKGFHKKKMNKRKPTATRT
ncbi:hypothetical protein ACROYT_G004113 [Oculina patagonica]